MAYGNGGRKVGRVLLGRGGGGPVQLVQELAEADMECRVPSSYR